LDGFATNAATVCWRVVYLKLQFLCQNQFKRGSKNMTYDYDFLQANFEAKIKEISKLKQDLVEREDETMYWYRQFEDAKEVARSTDSAKTRKHHHSRLKRGKKT
jgi:hypothetical protein